MKTYLDKVFPAYQKKVLDLAACDWCGTVTYESGRSTKQALHHDIVDDEWFDFEYTKGCGEGTHLITSGWKIEDICHDCIPRLRDLLRDAGITLTEIDL